MSYLPKTYTYAQSHEAEESVNTTKKMKDTKYNKLLYFFMSL